MLQNIEYSLKKDKDLVKIYSCKAKKDEVSKMIDQELSKIAEEVEMPGFRKGKVPIDTVRAKFSDRAFYYAVNNIVNTTSAKIVKESGLKLLTRPEIKFESDLKAGIDLKFIVILNPKANVSDVKFEKISFTTYKIAMSEKEEREELDKFLEKNPSFSEALDLSAVVENGDKVEISFDGSTENGPIEGGKSDSYQLEIGSKSFIDTFEEQIIGHKVGDEFEVNVKFPAEYPQNKDLENKPAIFKVKVFKVFKKTPSELNEEFVKKYNIESVEKFKEIFFENTKKSYESFERTRLKDDIIDAAVDRCDFDIPENLIEREIEARVEERKKSIKEGENFDEKPFIKEIKSSIEQNLKVFYLMDAVAELGEIKVSDDEVKGFVLRDAMQSGMDLKSVLDNLEKNDDLKNRIKMILQEEKVYKWLFEKITKKEKELSKKEFDKITQEYGAKRQKN